MRTGVTLSVTSADLDRLRALVKDRNAPQKHVWRAQIVLLSAEGVGTNAIMCETGRSKGLRGSPESISRVHPVERTAARIPLSRAIRAAY